MKTAFRVLIFLAFFLLPFTANAFTSETFDTIAGFETVVKISEAKPKENFVVRLISTDGRRTLFSGITNGSGEARLEISGEYLRKAGEYRAEFISKNQNRVIGENSFRVYADNPDSDASGMYPENTSAAIGSPLKIIIRLQDQYGNPIEGHEVILTSSRGNDMVKRNAEFTNEHGNVVFFISSYEAGTSVLTAYDETEKMTFSKRVAITFQNSALRSQVFASGIGGDTETRVLALNDVLSEVAEFEILDIKAEPRANESLSFRVKAVDAAGGLVTDYAKTVVFSSTDLAAVLPLDYTFQPSDLGEHIFELSLSFKTQGEQKLIVEEKDNPDAKGEVAVSVKPQRASAPISDVSITKPTPGSYGTRSLEIEGTAPPNSNVTIYDNGQQIGITRASSIGRFTWSVTNLADSLHAFTVEANGILSQEVEVTISAGGSQVEEVRLTPNPAAPGENIEVYLRSTPDLERVSVTFQDLLITLQPHPTDTGAYFGNITAPSRSGNYSLDLELVDQFGNESAVTEAETLVVDESLSRRGPAVRVPSRVTGVRAAQGPGRVTLSWEPSTDDTGIAYYKIYYGIDRNNLNQVAQTPDARTVWYISNLESRVQYFFQVVGVDTEGNEGHQRSAVVGAVPNEGGVGVLASEFVTPPDQLPQDGPALWFAFSAAFLAGLFQRLRRRF